MQHDEVFGALLDTAIPWADKLRQIRGLELDNTVASSSSTAPNHTPCGSRSSTATSAGTHPATHKHSLTCAGATIRRPPPNSRPPSTIARQHSRLV